MGHPELCRRPCIFFANGECRNSESCSFCHLSHAHRSSTLDKKQRQLLKELTSGPALFQTLFFMSPRLRIPPRIAVLPAK